MKNSNLAIALYKKTETPQQQVISNRMERVNKELHAACESYDFTFAEAQWLSYTRWQAYAMNFAGEKIAKLKKVSERKFLIFIDGGNIAKSSLAEATAVIAGLHSVLKD